MKNSKVERETRNLIKASAGDCSCLNRIIELHSRCTSKYCLELQIFTAIFLLFLNQYNIKKKEEIVEQPPQEEPNPLMRKKKTPEELAAEAEQEDLDDFTSKYLKKFQIDALVVLISGQF